MRPYLYLLSGYYVPAIALGAEVEENHTKTEKSLFGLSSSVGGFHSAFQTSAGHNLAEDEPLKFLAHTFPVSPLLKLNLP